MKLSTKTKSVYTQITPKTKLGDLRKMAKEIKTDHTMAMELWSTGEFLPRQLAILLLDKKLLDQESIDQLDRDIQKHPRDERNQLIDWLLANQFTRDKKIVSLMETWEKSSSALQRRVFWYYQARLRWMGNTDHENTEELLSAIEKNLMKEVPEVQWAMNFTAAWIGVYEERFRKRCIQIGEKTGLYKDDVVSKGCTPDYLPAFIEMEVRKRKTG